MARDMTAKRHSETEAKAIMDRLRECSLDELDSMFQQGRVPTFPEIAGRNLGIELAWNPRAPRINKMTWWVVGDGYFSRWSGMEFIKPFDDDKRGDGFNLYRNRYWKRRFRFETYVAEAVSDNDPCLRINYRFPSPQTAGFDDARMTEDGVLLARAYAKTDQRFRWNPLFMFYWVTVSVEQAS
jgi:hypothetical protein